MNIIDQDPKGYFDKIVDTEPKNRPWVLSVIINCILGVALVTTFFVFRGIAEKADARADKAERDLAIERANSLKDGKDCLKEILAAKTERDLYWSAKYDNLQEQVNQRANQLEIRINKLSRTASNIKNKVGI